ncbi:hypothetical protein HOH45_05440 [bacterium]|nr:hypothetical protein [bacterium]
MINSIFKTPAMRRLGALGKRTLFSKRFTQRPKRPFHNRLNFGASTQPPAPFWVQQVRPISTSKFKEINPITRIVLDEDAPRLVKYALKSAGNGERTTVLNEFKHPEGTNKVVSTTDIDLCRDIEKDKNFSVSVINLGKSATKAFSYLFSKAHEKVSNMDADSSSFDGEPATIIHSEKSLKTDACLQRFYATLHQYGGSFNFLNSEAHFIANYMVTDLNETGTLHCHADYREVVVQMTGDKSSQLLIKATRELNLANENGISVSVEYNEETNMFHHYIINEGATSQYIHIKFHGAAHAFTVHPNPKSENPSIVGEESNIGFISIHSDMETEKSRIETFSISDYSKIKHSMTAATIFLHRKSEINHLQEWMKQTNTAPTQLLVLSRDKFRDLLNFFIQK